ncbi:MAG TPA: phage holin family protein [Vicinamibacterales bacterium]
MASTTEPSIADVLKSAVRDAQDLVREEIALAKAEARQAVSRVGSGIAMLAGAAIAGLVGLILLLTAISWAISEVFGLPAWAGFGITTVVMLVIAGVLAMVGKRRMNAARAAMPRTVDTMKENMEWMRARTS